MWSTREWLARWALDESLLQTLLDPVTAHAELIRRRSLIDFGYIDYYFSSVVILLLLEHKFLDSSHLDALWSLAVNCGHGISVQLYEVMNVY